MDKKKYYRLLGLQEHATSSQITKAYETRILRLKSADYADDPGYVQRKIAEARYAYSVLMGTAAPETTVQRKRNFEEFKDHVDDGCFEDRNCSLKKKKKKAIDVSFSMAKAKGQLGSLTRKVNVGPEGKTTAIIIIVILVGIMGSAVSACNTLNNFSYEEPVYSVEQTDPNDLLYMAQVDRVLARPVQFDFYGWLDGSDPVPADKIQWEITDDMSEEIWSRSLDLCTCLDLYSLGDSVNYFMGQSDFYWISSDYDVSLALVQIMGAPEFEEIAGFRDIYNQEFITDYNGYLKFLVSVAADQAWDVCGEPVDTTYYY